MIAREVEVGEGVGLGVLQQLAGPPAHGRYLGRRAAVRRAHERGVALGEHGLHGRQRAGLVGPRREPPGDVALEVHDAALPGGRGRRRRRT